MAGEQRGPGAAITSINVTPLVDITLVLLIVFMVTAKLVVSQRVLGLDLPPAATGEVIQQVLAVELARDGSVRVNGEALAEPEAIVGRARSALGRAPGLRAVIQADGAVPHRAVIQVLDGLRRAGVVKTGFGVVPERRPETGK